MSVKHSIIGKTIADVHYSDNLDAQVMTMTFTDGSVFTLTADDGYGQAFLTSGYEEAP